MDRILQGIQLWMIRMIFALSLRSRMILYCRFHVTTNGSCSQTGNPIFLYGDNPSNSFQVKNV